MDNFRLQFWKSIVIIEISTLEVVKNEFLAKTVNLDIGSADVVQFVIFNPWKVPWNWIAFYQNSFVVSPGCYISWLDAILGNLQTRPLLDVMAGWVYGNKILKIQLKILSKNLDQTLFTFILLGDCWIYKHFSSYVAWQTLSWQNVRHFLGLLIKMLFSFSKLFKTKSTFLYEKYPLLCLFVDLYFLNKALHKVCSKRSNTLIGLTFAGINFRYNREILRILRGFIFAVGTFSKISRFSQIRY